MKEVYKKLFELRKLTGKVVKSKKNPFFKTMYSDLNSVIEATDTALETAGLLWLDRISDDFLVYDIIDPESGEMITGQVRLIMNKQDMQQLGSAITYARRYARMTACGLQAVDDDGNTATGKTFIRPPQIKRIGNLLMETKTKAEMFLGHYHVQAIKDLDQAAADNAEKPLRLREKEMNNAK